jgi:PhnB protein
MAKKSKTKAKAKSKTKVKKGAAKAKAKKTAKKAAGRQVGRKKVVAKAKRAAPKRKAAKKAAPKAKRAAAAKPRRSEVPEGYSSVTAYLIAQDAAGAIEYYKLVFGAEEELRMPSPGGRVGHAELKIGDSKIMLADEHPEMNAHGPRHHNGSPVTIMLYVEDVDATVARAIAEGGRLVREVKTQFYGDRSGAVEDPQGHIWHIATHVEDVTPQEIKRRMDAMMAEQPRDAEPA